MYSIVEKMGIFRHLGDILMKYQVRKAAGAYWIIDMEQKAFEFRKPVAINETGYEIFKMLEKGFDEEKTSEELALIYGISAEDAKADVKTFCKMLSENNISISKELQ